VSGAGLPEDLLQPVHVRSKSDLRGFMSVGALLARLAPDIIHAQDRRAGLVSALVARTKAPVVHTFHGVPDSAAGRWVKAGPLLGRHPGVSGGSRLIADALLARRVGCTVAPSRAMAAYLHHELRVPQDRLQVLHNGVSIPARHKQVTCIRTFVTVGSFEPCKATPVLVEAFLALTAHREGLRLRMVGEGSDRRRCEELAELAGAGDVEFPGYRTDVDAQLAQADVFVLPSLNENLPLALLQAMAMGLPCIASDVGGISEVLDAGCGILVTPGDAGSLRAAMERMIAEPDLAARLGAMARQRVAERFSLPRCADDHVRLWSEILTGGRG
jgi:glycosyltransferase involved in cell wall biosynthesis